MKFEEVGMTRGHYVLWDRSTGKILVCRPGLFSRHGTSTALKRRASTIKAAFALADDYLEDGQ